MGAFAGLPAMAGSSLVLSDQPGWNGWTVEATVKAGFREHGGAGEAATPPVTQHLNVTPFGVAPHAVFTLPVASALMTPALGEAKDKAEGSLSFTYTVGTSGTQDAFAFVIDSNTSAVNAKHDFGAGLVPADAFFEGELKLRTFAPLTSAASIRLPDLRPLTSPATETMTAQYHLLPFVLSGFMLPGDAGYTLPLALAPGQSFEYTLNYAVVTPYGEDPHLIYSLNGSAFDHTASEKIPNSRMDVVGGLGDTVISFPATPLGPAAAEGWTQSLLTGTHLATQVGLSTTTTDRPGGCGNVLTILTDSPGNGSSGSTVTLALPAEVPRNSTGYLDIRVVSGSVRYGFLINQSGDTVFEENNLLPNPALPPGEGGWQRVQFHNSTKGAGSIAVQVYAAPGVEARVEIDSISCGGVRSILPSYDYTGYFGPLQNRGDNVCQAGEIPVMGDFNGDGMDDVASFVRSSVNGPGQGTVRVSLNQGGGKFATAKVWQDWFCLGNEIPKVGDFNGDGLDDIVSFVPGTGKVWVALNVGGSFGASAEWYLPAGFLEAATDLPDVGDFDGDGRDDIVRFSRSTTGEIGVALSDGACFGARRDWDQLPEAFCPGNSVPCVGDLNGDGRDDVVCFLRDSVGGVLEGDVRVHVSVGVQFQPADFYHPGSTHFAPTDAYAPFLADWNGDGFADLGAVRDDGRVFVAIANLAPPFNFYVHDEHPSDPLWQWHSHIREPGELVLPGRFNRDANADLFVFPRGLRTGNDGEAALVSLCGGHALPEPESRRADFGYGTMGAGPVPVVRPLLVLVSECDDHPLSRTMEEYEQGVFGPAHPNLSAWFSEMSNGAFTFSRATIVHLGPYSCPLPELTSVRTQLEDAANVDGPGGFEFKNYDTNHDGIVETSELALLGISSVYRAAGQTFPVDQVIFPGDASRQVRVALKWSFVGDNDTLTTMAHELCHGACGMVDLYGSHCRGIGLTLASCTSSETTPTDLVHLDPWHKIRMGWVRPLIYDIKEFPAGAAIRPPQSGAARPVILYDSSRGTHEFHILEHRNGRLSNGTQTWTAPGGPWRPRNRPYYPAAGYDTDVQSTDNNVSGYLTWAVKTDNSHNVLDVVQRIGSGPDQILDSPTLGDDSLWPTSGPPAQIHCGPDGILQSLVEGDDIYWQDALCLPVPNPADMLGREVSSLTAFNQAPRTLSYYNSDDSGVLVYPDSVYGNEWQFLEWGRNFRPFIENIGLPARPLQFGDRVLLSGSLGSDQRWRPYLVSMVSDNVYPLYLDNWSGKGAVVAITGGIPAGQYRLMLMDHHPIYKWSSNSFIVTVTDGCQLWREAHFTPAELEDPNVSGEEADADLDGLPNLVEMILDTDPRIANPLPLITWNLWEDGTMYARLAFRNDRCRGSITLQSSTDLSVWTDDSRLTLSGSGAGGGEEFFISDPTSTPAPRKFYRFKFEHRE